MSLRGVGRGWEARTDARHRLRPAGRRRALRAAGAPGV